MLRLSVIIPMYNVEPYVEKCIRSLENQDIPHTDYEIICVNDGSPDDSRGVVERLSLEYENIKLVNQYNQGVSMARNNAIAIARGEYLLMIDPDDYVDENSLSSVLNTAVNFQAQVSFLGYTFLNADGSAKVKIFHEKYKSNLYSGIQAYFIARGDGKTDPDRLVGVLFEREFIENNQLTYLPDIPYLEDGELMARIMCLAERCCFDGKSFYSRTTRPGSATNSSLFYSEKAISGFLKAALNLKKFSTQESLSSKQRVFLNQPIVKFTHLSLYPDCLGGRYGAFYKTILHLRKIKLLPSDLTGCNAYYKLDGYLLKFHPLFFYLHRLFGAPFFRLINYKY